MFVHNVNFWVCTFRDIELSAPVLHISEFWYTTYLSNLNNLNAVVWGILETMWQARKIRFLNYFAFLISFSFAFDQWKLFLYQNEVGLNFF